MAKRNLLLSLSSILIIIGIIICNYNYYKEYQNMDDNTILLEDFFQEEISSNIETYFGVLEIPKISLKRGFYDTETYLNNINKNIELINFSDTNITLVAHSGSSYVSYFRNIYLLENNDLVYLYFNNDKYTYKVSNKEYVDRDGTISINNNYSTKTLILTTCGEDQTQLIITALLV